MDYGYNHASSDSLRAIKGHKFVDPLIDPGEVDLSAMVDFEVMKKIFEQDNADGSPSKMLSTHAIGQGEFLRDMGIEARAAKLLTKCISDDDAMNIISGFDRLLDKDKMGESHKVLTVVNTKHKHFIPPGFIVDKFSQDETAQK